MCKLRRSILWLCIVAMVVSVMAPTAFAADSSTDWTMNIQKIDVVDRLETTQTMTNYDGSTYDQVFTDEPGEGNCFAVVTIGVSKQSADASAFPINEIQLNVPVGGDVCLPYR